MDDARVRRRRSAMREDDTAHPEATAAEAPAEATPQDLDPRRCQHPGVFTEGQPFPRQCPRDPVPPSSQTGGMPPRYCDDQQHTAKTAWREWQRYRAATRRAEGPATADLDRPVSFAGLRVRDAVEQLGSVLTDHRRALTDQQALLDRALDDLATIGNPDAVEAELSAVQTEA